MSQFIQIYYEFMNKLFFYIYEYRGIDISVLKAES